MFQMLGSTLNTTETQKQKIYFRDPRPLSSISLEAVTGQGFLSYLLFFSPVTRKAYCRNLWTGLKNGSYSGQLVQMWRVPANLKNLSYFWYLSVETHLRSLTNVSILVWMVTAWFIINKSWKYWLFNPQNYNKEGIYWIWKWAPLKLVSRSDL